MPYVIIDYDEYQNLLAAKAKQTFDIKVKKIKRPDGIPYNTEQYAFYANTNKGQTYLGDLYMPISFTKFFEDNCKLLINIKES